MSGTAAAPQTCRSILARLLPLAQAQAALMRRSALSRQERRDADDAASAVRDARRHLGSSAGLNGEDC